MRRHVTRITSHVTYECVTSRTLRVGRFNLDCNHVRDVRGIRGCPHICIHAHLKGRALQCIWRVYVYKYMKTHEYVRDVRHSTNVFSF